MISEKMNWRIFLRISALFITLLLAAFFVVRERYAFLLLILPVIIYQLIELYRSQLATRRELLRFFEAIKYEDFTGNYSSRKNSSESSLLKEGFNTINTAFRKLSREKETQYQYLQNILELVNTGILCFNQEEGGVIWMNETLKKMLNLPYLRTVQAFEKRDKALYNDIIGIKTGEFRITTIYNGAKSFKVLLSATSFLIEGKPYSLLALQNINEVMDETESKAWQKLLSVLTHEIMNSIAPISSLAETIGLRLKEIDKNNNQPVIEDLELGIATIKNRSDGLLKFAETYRNLNKIIVPDLRRVYARDLFESIYTLMQPNLNARNIEFEIILKDPDLYFSADKNLMEQVLINLVLNSIDSVKERDDPRIAISAYKEENDKTTIRVSDNGGGIPDDLLDKIFIPFFSTKKNGSGIGLTLCKQIMLLHHGNIEARNLFAGQADFVLTL